VFPPATPFTCQVTAVFVTPVTLAVNCCVLPVNNNADAGDNRTAALELEGEVTITVAEADLDVSAILVAVTV
jgi:hypothetical protein